MIDNCLTYHSQYLGGRDAGGSCLVNRDFIGARLEPQDVTSLLQLYTAGTITQETLLTNLAEPRGPGAPAEWTAPEIPRDAPPSFTVCAGYGDRVHAPSVGHRLVDLDELRGVDLRGMIP